MSKVAEYKQVISDKTFFAYACQMLESLYHPMNGDSGISACGQLCPHAKRRHTLNQIGADPMAIHQAMQSLPPPQVVQSQQSYVQHAQPYNMIMVSGGADINSITPDSSVQPLMQPFQGNLDSIHPPPSIEPLQFNQGLFVTGVGTHAPALGGDIEPLPYAPGPLNTNMTPGGSITAEVTAPTYPSYPNSLAPIQVSAPNCHQNSLEPLPFQNESCAGLVSAQAPSSATCGSVFSLRKCCSEDLEMTSEEGKILMGQLNLEVDDIIRRKSYGLIQIDTTHAFEDLVFEDDSLMIDDPKPKESPPKKEKRPSSSSSSAGRHSGLSSNTSGRRHSSGLSYRDDMSLMNMSILTLDEKGEEGSDNNSLMEGSSPREENTGRKSIIKHHDTSTPKNIRNRKTRVSFAGKNISLMSMDDRSFSQLVDSISDPDADAEQDKDMSVNSTDSHAYSRKMGFPMRKTVAAKYAAATPPLEVDQKKDGTYDKVSTLTISEGDPPLHQSDFTNLAGQVENPSGVGNSLRLNNMSLSNVSAFRMSNMSLSSDIDPELLS
mmetsp:Transcript_35750/g.65539  ORF Transcript_35750/g.65539 Transcript_35750/m.65539 type:complete len:547 (+) Transcript_35750:253-1893(+)